MQIKSVSIRNFRRLHDTKVEFSPDTTLLVGPNNSGKSSAILAIERFLNEPGRFRVTDISLSNLSTLSSIGRTWIDQDEADDPQSGKQIRADLLPLMPAIDIWFDANTSELAKFPPAVSELTQYPGHFGVRLALEARDPEMFRENFIRDYRKSAAALRGADQELQGISLRPTSLVQHLEKAIQRDFRIAGYVLPSSSPASEDGADSQPLYHADLSASNSDIQAVDPALIRRLVRVNVITATREMSEADARGNSERLSTMVGRFYANHIRQTETLSKHDLRAIHAEQIAINASNAVANDLLQDSLSEIQSLGYPGGGNPTPIFESDRVFEVPSRQMYLRHKVDEEIEGLRNLDESMNGLGYQSLIYMIFRMMGFRRSWLAGEDRLQNGEALSPGAHKMQLGIEPIHLVLVEEPEAFLHAQVQQVFIKRALEVLRKDHETPDYGTLHSQLVVSTHSSHIAQELNFDAIRYIKRETATAANPYPVSNVKNLTNVFGDATATAKFVRRIIRVHHCNMLFADALILIEGAAERILLPEMIKPYKSLSAAYIEIMDVGGSHAHQLRELVEALGVPTLVITDIDAMLATEAELTKKDGSPRKPILKKVRPELNQGQETGNHTLRKWLNRGHKLDDLLVLADDDKTAAGESPDLVRFAFQGSHSTAPGVVPSTFEDALALANLASFAEVHGEGLLKNFAKIASESSDIGEKAEKMYKALADGDKTRFALDVLYSLPDGSSLNPPEYIASGLAWLDEKVSSKGLLSVPQIPTKLEKAER